MEERLPTPTSPLEGEVVTEAGLTPPNCHQPTQLGSPEYLNARHLVPLDSRAGQFRLKHVSRGRNVQTGPGGEVVKSEVDRNYLCRDLQFSLVSLLTSPTILISAPKLISSSLIPTPSS